MQGVAVEGVSSQEMDHWYKAKAAFLSRRIEWGRFKVYEAKMADLVGAVPIMLIGRDGGGGGGYSGGGGSNNGSVAVEVVPLTWSLQSISAGLNGWSWECSNIRPISDCKNIDE